MKLLADLSALSSPYTWMTPPGRAPSPDVGDVLLAGDREGPGGAEPIDWEVSKQARAKGRSTLWGPQGILGGGFFLRAGGRRGLTSEPQELASVQNHSWGR